MPADGPFDEDAETQRGLMEVDPDAVGPGDVIEVRFADGLVRGVAFVLERRVKHLWMHEYWMTSAPGSRGTPSWAPATQDWGWDDIGVSGSEPDLLEIPHTAKPGEHRICTANPQDNLCAELEIAEPAGS